MRIILAGSILLALVGGLGLMKNRSNPTAKGEPSLSLQNPKPKQKPVTRPVTLAWAGDLTPGSKYGLPHDNGKSQLKEVRDLLTSADLTMVNLEGTLTSKGVDKCGGSGGSNCFSFAAPPSHASSLRRAGVDLVNLANNHSMDRGRLGLRETERAIERRNIKGTGAPDRITTARVHGIDIAVLGFAPYDWANDLRDLPRSEGIIKKAAKRADIVWVAMHAGAEGADQTRTPRGEEIAFGESRGNTRRFARLAIESGADLVTGSGPHVVRGMELHRGKLIAYSTGNFAGWHNFSLGGTLSESAILTIKLNRQGEFIAGKWHPLILNGPGIPSRDPERRSARTANRASRSDFHDKAVLIRSDNGLKLPGG